MFGNMQAPQLPQNTILSIGKRQFDSMTLHAKQGIDLPTSNQKNMTTLQKSGYYKVLLYKGCLYVIDGSGSCTVISTEKANTLEMGLKMQRQIVPRQQICDYTFKNATILSNEIYLFGKGEINSSQSSLIMKVNISSGIYQRFEGTGITPDFKEHCLIQSINNMYILQYGGYTQKDDSISNDAYLLAFKQWKKLKINHQISPRYKFSYATCGNKVYLHGGQSNINGEVKYHSELYLLSISDVNFELSFSPVQNFSSTAPVARSGHCMTSLKDRYLVLFGGQTNAQNDGDKNATNFLRDMWFFDTFQKTWSLFDLPLPLQKLLNYQFQSIKNYKNQLYLLGFIDSEEKRKSKIIRFSFSEPWEVVKKQNIKKTDSDTEEYLEGKDFELTTSMLHCASYSLRFPFQAIQKIVEYVQDREATFIRIYSELTSNTIDKYIYISIDFDSKASVGKENSELEFDQLLYCSLRLGKTVLYVQNYDDSTQRRVTLISADGKFSPLVEKIQLKYSYTESKVTGLISKTFQSRNKTLILKIMQSLIENPIQLIRSVNNSKIMIFSPNIIPTPKTYYYELVFDSVYDISVFKNNKKVEMLQKLKYDLSVSMELSLHNFLKYTKCGTRFHNSISENENSKVNQPLKIYLNSYSEPIHRSVYYSKYLEEYCKKGKLIKLQIPKNTVQFTTFFELYACFDDFYLPENNGVLIFQKGKLVNRYDCEFGKVLAQKFYQKKIHKDNRNIFEVVGEIHVSDELKLINFDTQFQKTQKYLYFKLSVEKAIQGALKKIAPQLKMHEERPKEVVVSDVENNNSVNDTIVPGPEIRKNIGIEMTLERKQEMQNYNVYIDEDSVDSEVYNSISKKVKNDKNSQI